MDSSFVRTTQKTNHNIMFAKKRDDVRVQAFVLSIKMCVGQGFAFLSRPSQTFFH